MAEAAVQQRKPPRAAMRAMNAVMGLVLRSPLHGLMSGKALLLGFIGRKSGRRYVTPMSYVRVGDEVLMSTEAPWWKNLVGGAPVEVRLKGENRRGGDTGGGRRGGPGVDPAPLPRIPAVRRRYGGRGRPSRGGDHPGGRPPRPGRHPRPVARAGLRRGSGSGYGLLVRRDRDSGLVPAARV